MDINFDEMNDNFLRNRFIELCQKPQRSIQELKDIQDYQIEISKRMRKAFDRKDDKVVFLFIKSFLESEDVNNFIKRIIKEKDDDRLKEYLERCYVDLNDRPYGDKTWMQMAMESLDEAFVNELIALGGQIDNKCGDYPNMLVRAAEEGNVKLFEFCNQMDCSCDNTNFWKIVCESENKEFAKSLVSLGYKVNDSYKGGEAPMFLAVKYSSVKFLKFLVSELGGDLKLLNSSRNSISEIACREGKNDIVVWLLETKNLDSSPACIKYVQEKLIREMFKEKISNEEWGKLIELSEEYFIDLANSTIEGIPLLIALIMSTSIPNDEKRKYIQYFFDHGATMGIHDTAGNNLLDWAAFNKDHDPETLELLESIQQEKKNIVAKYADRVVSNITDKIRSQLKNTFRYTSKVALHL